MRGDLLRGDLLRGDLCRTAGDLTAGGPLPMGERAACCACWVGVRACSRSHWRRKSSSVGLLAVGLLVVGLLAQDAGALARSWSRSWCAGTVVPGSPPSALLAAKREVAAA